MEKKFQNLSHDALLAKCFQYTWNKYPQTRYCCFHVTNELRPDKGETKQQFIIRLAQAKAIGVVAGVMDLLFYWKGTLYAFDVKVGKDRLSLSQKDFIKAVEGQGGKCFEINNFEQFISIFDSILCKDATVHTTL